MDNAASRPPLQDFGSSKLSAAALQFLASSRPETQWIFSSAHGGMEDYIVATYQGLDGALIQLLLQRRGIAWHIGELPAPTAEVP